MSFLSSARARTETRMTDQVKFMRPGQDEIYDADTDTFTPASTTVVYEGKARIKQQYKYSQQPAQDSAQFKADVVALVPISVSNIQIGDVMTLLSSETDQEIAGTQFSVVFVDYSTSKTSRQIALEVYSE